MWFSCITSAAYILMVCSMTRLGHAEAGQLRAGGLQGGAGHPDLVLDLDLGVAGEQHGVAHHRRVARVAGRHQLAQPLGRRASPSRSCRGS